VLATTPEQTLLDLAKRPDLGEAPAQVQEAIVALLARVDLDRVKQIALRQRGMKAFTALQRLATERRGDRVGA